jgi:O-antigen/teichoic acid export membrane protein
VKGSVAAPKKRKEHSLMFGLSRDVLIYSTGDVASKALGFISVPIYTHIFLTAEYGVLALAASIGGLISGVMVLGGDTALSRFWFEDESPEARRRLVTTWIGFLALWSLVITVVLVPAVPTFVSFSGYSPEYRTTFWVLLATLPVSLVSRMLAQILRNEFRPVAYATTSFATGVLGLGAGLFAVSRLHKGVAGILTAFLLAEIVILAVRINLTWHSLAGSFDRNLLRRLLNFALPLVPVTVSFWIFTASDRIVLARLDPLKGDLGLYGLALSIASIFALLSGAVGQAWIPRTTMLYERDRERAASVIGASLTYYLFALGFVAVLISALAPEIIALVAAPKYAGAAGPLPLLALGSVAYGTGVLTSSGMSLTHNTRSLAVASAVTAVVNIGFAIALVPPLGMIGAALAGVLGYGVLTTSYLWISQRLWPIELEKRRLLVICASLAVTVALTSDVVHLPLAVRALMPLAFVGVVLGLAGITDMDRRIASSVKWPGR